jgi:hypothetical protein
MTQPLDKHLYDVGVACYLGGQPLAKMLSEAMTSAVGLESLRRGWLDEQARTWSTEWPTTRGHYWAWLQWRPGAGVAYGRGGGLIWPKEFVGALFCPIVPPLPAPLPDGVDAKP